jgi:hypothetical protein
MEPGTTFPGLRYSPGGGAGGVGLCHDHCAGRAMVESREACREHLRNAQGAEGIIHPGHMMTAQPGHDDL